MAWRLKHSTPKIWRAPGTPPTEPTVISDRTMEIGEKAARQQFAFYVQAWVDERPDDRHVTQRDGLNAWAVERPAGCTCTWCERHRAAAPEHADNEAWWRMGGTGDHVTSYIKLKRTTAPVTRATAPTWCVARRKGSHGAEGPIESVLSEHTTKAGAMQGLGRVVRDWRDYRTMTATKRGDDAYLLKRHATVQWSVRVERVTQS